MASIDIPKSSITSISSLKKPSLSLDLDCIPSFQETPADKTINSYALVFTNEHDHHLYVGSSSAASLLKKDLGVEKIALIFSFISCEDESVIVQEIEDDGDALIMHNVIKDHILNIHEALTRGHVLIQCHAGVSRSPTFVATYLMVYQQMSYKKAWNLIYSVRPIIDSKYIIYLQWVEKHRENFLDVEPPHNMSMWDLEFYEDVDSCSLSFIKTPTSLSPHSSPFSSPLSFSPHSFSPKVA